MDQYNELMDLSSEDMLTVNDVARLLKVHSNSVRRWSNQGLIKVYRVGRRGDRRFRRDDLIKFLDSWHSRQPGGQPTDENSAHQGQPSRQGTIANLPQQYTT